MSTILALPVMVVLVMVQSVIVSRLPLLNGTADLVLLVLIAWAIQEKVTTAWQWTLIGGLLVSLVSAMPYFSPLVSYLAAIAFTRLMQHRIWQTPVLAMFVATVFGTLFQHILYIAVLFVTGTSLPIRESLTLVTLPSMLLNLILSIPVYALVTDIARWVYPAEVQA